ncbi:hypothetical protein SPBRAN_484 [uncultured Candidatus Thioglobus sp.]|nr:hypothetical protein SPBRAN_484 [uncultured Candidatus Thioglobus sp.]
MLDWCVYLLNMVLIPREAKLSAKNATRIASGVTDWMGLRL